MTVSRVGDAHLGDLFRHDGDEGSRQPHEEQESSDWLVRVSKGSKRVGNHAFINEGQPPAACGQRPGSVTWHFGRQAVGQMGDEAEAASQVEGSSRGPHNVASRSWHASTLARSTLVPRRCGGGNLLLRPRPIASWGCNHLQWDATSSTSSNKMRKSSSPAPGGDLACGQYPEIATGPACAYLPYCARVLRGFETRQGLLFPAGHPSRAAHCRPRRKRLVQGIMCSAGVL